MEIIFNEKGDTSSHHEEPLVITLRIGSYDVCRIMVEKRSLVGLLFLFTVRALSIKEIDIIRRKLPLIRFNNNTTYAVATVVLPVIGKGSIVMTNFVEIDIPTHYNAIFE